MHQCSRGERVPRPLIGELTLRSLAELVEYQWQQAIGRSLVSVCSSEHQLSGSISMCIWR